ncbi:hypothetical protein EV401DRAFT_2020481 [Pisolithus croceorrhizus]|nr:hypothetical protein EV401DRAFT_2020481 [Pisolithus croceorrhizus]
MSRQTVLWNTVANVLANDGDERDLPVNGLSYAIGHEPATAPTRNWPQMDEDGCVVTVLGSAQTSVNGVFATGDVQDKRYRQAITSAGSGCMAALEVERLLAEEEADSRGDGSA